MPDNLYRRRVQTLETLSNFDDVIWGVHDVPYGLKRNIRCSEQRNARDIFSKQIDGQHAVVRGSGASIFQIAADLPGAHRGFTEGETVVIF